MPRNINKAIKANAENRSIAKLIIEKNSRINYRLAQKLASRVRKLQIVNPLHIKQRIDQVLYAHRQIKKMAKEIQQRAKDNDSFRSFESAYDTAQKQFDLNKQDQLNKTKRNEEQQSVFDNSSKQYFFKPTEENEKDLLFFLSDNKEPLKKSLIETLVRFDAIKDFIEVQVVYSKTTEDEYDKLNNKQKQDIIERENRHDASKKIDIQNKVVQRLFTNDIGDDIIITTIYKTVTLRSQVNSIQLATKISSKIDLMYNEVIKESEEIALDGSEWKFEGVIKMTVFISKHVIIRGASYIDLPGWLKDKRAILNIKNDDNECFRWSVLAALHPVDSKENPNRKSKYVEFKDELDFTGIEFPVKLDDIEKFEKLNDISINVLYNQGEIIRTALFSEYKSTKDIVINLFLVIEEQEYNISEDLVLDDIVDKCHYTLINNVSRLIGSQVSTHGGTKYPCLKCLNLFYTEHKFSEHQRIGCGDSKDPAKLILPKKEDAFIQFKNYNNALVNPFVIDCDFESLTNKLENNDDTGHYQNHKACGFGYKIISCFDEMTKPVKNYRAKSENEDIGEIFIDKMLEVQEEIFDYIYNPKYPKLKDIVMTPEEKKQFKEAKECYICNKPCDSSDKRRDHCHYSGKYRGCAHNACNLNLNYEKYQIPVIFHNLKGYDAHIIIKAFNRKFTNLHCIASTEEKFITFSFEKLKFIDSLAHLSGSLDTLSSNLPKDGFKHLEADLSGTYTKEQIDLLKHKGVYPYDYMDSFERFNETKLPPIEKFYSKLKDSALPIGDYLHAQNVWNKFGIKNLGEYHDLYLKTDVLLLADVFENYRKTSHKHYGLDPAHYITLPSFAWDCMLKTINKPIELIDNSNTNMYLLIEKNIRGGVSFVANRYGKANNKYMGAKWNPAWPSKYLMYLDANNLYGWAMSQKLPIGKLKYENADEFTEYIIKRLDPEGETGYFFEVDLEIPENLHDFFNDYPMAVESMAVEKDKLSDYSKKLRSDLNIKGAQSKKLVPNLCNKTNYLCHYRNLQFYLQKGFKLGKIHTVISFHQEAFLQPYIQKNTDQRAKKGISDFEKDFWKLMNNAPYGKFLENVRKHIDFKLCNDEKHYLKYIARPNYRRETIINNDVRGIHFAIKEINLNKPQFVGFAVLELSKLHMYKFYYDVLKTKYGEKVKLLYTDTDSLLMEIETDDFYNDILIDDVFKDNFDLSEYDKDHKLYDDKNKKVLGKFKDETPSGIIEEFIGIRSKMYSMQIHKPDGEQQHKARCKGVAKHLIYDQERKDAIKHKDFMRCVFGTKLSDKKQYANQCNLVSKNHNIYANKIHKISLSAFDDKSYYIDSSTSRRLGHYLNGK